MQTKLVMQQKPFGEGITFLGYGAGPGASPGADAGPGPSCTLAILAITKQSAINNSHIVAAKQLANTQSPAS